MNNPTGVVLRFRRGKSEILVGLTVRPEAEAGYFSILENETDAAFRFFSEADEELSRLEAVRFTGERLTGE